MSKYKTIATDLQDATILHAALQDVGLPFEWYERTTPGEQMYGFFSTEQQQAHVIIRKAAMHTRWNDFGLRWNGTRYEAVLSADAGDTEKGMAVLTQLKQRYAVRQAIALAAKKGLTLIEQREEHGVIRLRLGGYH